jgi:hypothetical protein
MVSRRERTIVQEDEVKPNPTGFLAALGTYKLGKIISIC